MRVAEEFVVRNWRIRVIVLEYNLVGLMLYGPHKKAYYIPPIGFEERIPLPKYVEEVIGPILRP